MKLKSLVVAVALAAGSTSAMSALIAPPAGGLHIKFQNQEQICFTNCITAPSGAAEGNWGIFDVTTIASARNVIPNTTFAANPTPLWTNLSGGEYTGIFWGIQLTGPSTATGGFMELYYDPSNNIDLNYNPASRTGDNQYTTATDGQLLVRINFAPGAAEDDAVTTLTSNCDISTGIYVNCKTTLYGDVADINNDGTIDAADGLWASYLNTDWFYVNLDGNGIPGDSANERRDFFFQNQFNSDSNWNEPGNPQIIGANSDDPARAFFVPEPGTLMLLGGALLGLGITRRRKA